MREGISTSVPATGRGRAASAALPRPDSSDQADALAAQLVDQMRAAWRRGDCLAAEEFLHSHPELCAKPHAAVRLIYEEICLRQECGQEVDSVAVVARFPHWEAELRFLLDCHGLLQPVRAVPVFPSVGQTWADFHLLAKLGRGSFGHVFLATQHSLADRPVVLKMMAVEEGEHLSLARLQHTHIMPLYAVEEDPARHVRALCMPYFGGASLQHILEALTHQPVAQRTGRDILNALDRLQAAVPVTLPTQGPVRQLLAQASYVQAVCWLGACLAEALQYAHQRGLVHLDVKPHNVLLSGDGQPMLLDFNLAREPLRPGAVTTDSFGGTPEYMSPEQELAVAQMRSRLPIGTAVDARSDIYSLGLVLYEALAGQRPCRAAPRPLHDANPQVSLGLADLIHKCLAPKACDRYADAAALAVDLRRHLSDLPLRGIVNRSLCERWGKWRRRRPHALVQVTLVLTLLAAGAGAVLDRQGNIRRQLQAAETALADGQAELRSQAYEAAVRTLVRGIASAEAVPGSCALRQRLDEQLRLAQRAHVAYRLHRLTERLRFVYGMDPISAQPELEVQCRRVWDMYNLLPPDPSGELEPALANQLKDDLRDLAILWADLHVRLATTQEAAEARRDALRLLGEVEARLGSSVVLARARQAHAEALGRTDLAQAAARRAAELAPKTAWEYSSLGRLLLHAGNPTQAMVELEHALDLRPQDFWANFYHGTCAYRLQRYEDAVSDFHVCLALAPDRAECHYNRALAETALGRTERALRDYGCALRLDPHLAAAALNRGILHYQEKHYEEALADFQRALDNGANSATLHYNKALVYWARRERGAALKSLRRVLDLDRQYEPARQLYARLLAE